MDELVKALRAGEQADMDGTLVKVSRQACEEAADAIEALQARVAKKDAEIERLREALADAEIMRDAAERVSEWFCTEARHLEGHRINALRMAMIAYNRHMQPNPDAALETRDG